MKDIPEKKCIICGNSFPRPYYLSYSQWEDRLYCSRECQHKSMLKSPKLRRCEYCGKEYERHTGCHDQKFCSQECSGKGTDWTKRPQYILEAHNGSTVKCLCGCGTAIPMYDKKFRRMKYAPGHTWDGRKRPRSKDVIEKHRISLIAGGKIKGEKHWNWKGGISEPMKALRRTKEYDDWRFAVYKRDSYFCQECGIKTSSGTIVAHHLKDFRNNPELRYSVPNGITLCRKCHIKIHKY